VQQTIAEFLEAVEATRQKRKNLAENGDAEGLAQVRYPWKRPRYRSVTFTNQAPRRKGNRLVVPCGRIGGKRAYLSVPLPKDFVEPGRLMEARLEFCTLALVYAIPESDEVFQDDMPVVAVDPGVNTLIAATDGVTAVLVSGRAVKSFVQYRNKTLAEISASGSAPDGLAALEKTPEGQETHAGPTAPEGPGCRAQGDPDRGGCVPGSAGHRRPAVQRGGPEGGSPSCPDGLAGRERPDDPLPRLQVGRGGADRRTLHVANVPRLR
jgi:hypothetical protein